MTHVKYTYCCVAGKHRYCDIYNTASRFGIHNFELDLHFRLRRRKSEVYLHADSQICFTFRFKVYANFLMDECNIFETLSLHFLFAYT
jgi:hypothetical protein